MYLVDSCELRENQADGFDAANAWTDISEKLKIKLTLVWCRCVNSLHTVFTYQYLKKETRRINYKPEICQNAALQLNGAHVSSP